jgi:hypothetical protein
MNKLIYDDVLNLDSSSFCLFILALAHTSTFRGFFSHTTRYNRYTTELENLKCGGGKTKNFNIAPLASCNGFFPPSLSSFFIHSYDSYDRQILLFFFCFLSILHWGWIWIGLDIPPPFLTDNKQTNDKLGILGRKGRKWGFLGSVHGAGEMEFGSAYTRFQLFWEEVVERGGIYIYI